MKESDEKLKQVGRWLGWLVAVWFGCIGLRGTAAWAETTPNVQELLTRIERLEEEVSTLRSQIGVVKEGVPTLPQKAAEFAEKGLAPELGGVYTKPFLRRFGRNTYVGGYADLEWNETQNANSSFRQHRMIPFIYSDVSDRIKFATEIEFEDAGPQNNASDGQVKLEFATIDFLIQDWINFRAGLLLDPLGKLNLVHDSPIQDLTNRPLVDTFIIPTTLSEPGAGFYGTFYPFETHKLDYEVYLAQGFRALDANGTVRVNNTNGLRNARPSAKSDLNDEPAVVGRIAYSPFLGLELGYSSHLGTYDQVGENYLMINAVDATYQRGPWEFLGELAYADFERDRFAISKNVPDAFFGYYAQINYHFMPKFLREASPVFFGENSTFTGVIRWDQIDLDSRITDRLSLGLNYRFTEDTVFKLEYQFNWEQQNQGRVQDDGVVASVATYF